MKSGRIEQVGSPDEVYHAPASPFVYEFLGDVNKFTHGRLAYARPYEIEVHLDSAGADYIPAKVGHVVARGAVMRVELVTGNEAHPIEADLSRERLNELDLSKGKQVFIRATSLRTFDAHAAE
jgi:sulfate transport system ATP-binding protein